MMVFSFLARLPVWLYQNRTVSNVAINTFVPVSYSILTRSFVIVLGLISTFRAKVCSSLEDRSNMAAAYSLRVYTCKLLFVQMNGVPQQRLEITPRDEPVLWKAT